ncbi:MAG: ImcF-related family protein [Pseudomonadota bacterium]
MGAVELYRQAARPVFALIEDLETEVRAGEVTLVGRAEDALRAFSQTLERSAAPRPAIAPARLALAVLIDARARAQPRLKLARWSASTRSRLFDGRDVTPATLGEFTRTAEGAGPDYAGLAEFLREIAGQVQSGGRALTRERSSWGWFAALSVVLVLGGLAGYASWLEYRFHAKINANFQQDIQRHQLTPDMTRRDIAQALTGLAEARDRVARAARFAPLRRTVRLPVGDSETLADTVYAEAVASHGLPVLSAALDEVLATEGDSLKLYDALRARGVLTGDTEWRPGYIAGWLEDNETALDLPGFARHAEVLPRQSAATGAVDTLVLDQARAFAAEASEGERVWLELLRAEETRALPAWRPEVEVPGLGDILVRRSGVPLDSPVPGLFTEAGWAYARDFGTGVAVQEARRLVPIVLGVTPRPVNETPDLVQARLHAETLAIWQNWLADLRVEPFDDPDRAILVSGTLAQRDNPLTRALRAVWTQIGGEDRGRAFDQQVELGRVFGPVIQYLDGGGMDGLGRLFSSLNVALSTLEADTERGAQALIGVGERARTVDVLQAAPRIIVQIAEDVLAQASAATTQTGADPLILRWQQAVYPACRATLDGRYPFAEAADASDATAADVTALLAPGGSLMQFFNAYLAQYLDAEVSPWRWKPEARFAGLDPDSAAFFETATFLSEALFDSNGQLLRDVTLATLAERGTTTVALGGQGVPVRATGEPVTLSWPGPAPLQGAVVSFRETGTTADLSAPGYWGLMRLLDRFRVRFRDDGARLLVDLRSPEGRAFVEIGLDAPANPFAARRLMAGFSCPPRL